MMLKSNKRQKSVRYSTDNDDSMTLLLGKKNLLCIFTQKVLHRRDNNNNHLTTVCPRRNIHPLHRREAKSKQATDFPVHKLVFMHFNTNDIWLRSVTRIGKIEKL